MLILWQKRVHLEVKVEPRFSGDLCISLRSPIGAFTTLCLFSSLCTSVLEFRDVDIILYRYIDI